MAENTMLTKAKLALRLRSDAYDSEITDLINAAKQDLGIAGVVLPAELDALCGRAIITYVKVHFGASADADYDRLKRSYDEQKAQLMTATGYTVWGVADATS